jgi:dephospho-CoA kinase
MRTIGLTGGIGSGKSTVAQMLAEENITIIDADALSRGLTQTGGAAMASIELVFGAAMMATDGSLNREAMRTLMLGDTSAKARLEAIIHPLVGEQIHAQLARASDAGAKLAVVDIPLLVEAGVRWRKRLDAVWVVDCLPATQIERVRARSAWPLAQIEAVMAAQSLRDQRLACADAVICNESVSLVQLKQSVKTWLALNSWPQAVKAGLTSGL